MSGFSVEPTALNDLAACIERQARHLEAVRKHLREFRELEYGPENTALHPDVHKSTFDEIDDWLATIKNKSIEPTAEAVRAAMKYYLKTDDEAAEKADQTTIGLDPENARRSQGSARVNPNARPDIQVGRTVGRFDDVDDVLNALRTVSRDEFALDEMAHIEWYEFFSISSWANETFLKATELLSWIGLLDRPYSPLEELWRPFAGDWVGVLASAAALDNAETAVSRVSRNIRWVSQGVEEVWKGNAGNGAATHLVLTAEPLREAVEPFHNLSIKYEDIAADMVKYRDALVGMFKELVDTAAELAAAGAIAGGSASSGVGAPIGGLAGLYAIYKGYKLVSGIEKLLGYIDKFFTAVDVWEAELAAFKSRDGSGASLPRPYKLTMTVPGE